MGMLISLARVNFPTYRLVVERLNDPFTALSRRKDHLHNNERLRLDNLAALHLATKGGHRALHVRGRSPWREVLAHDCVWSGEAADGHAHA